MFWRFGGYANVSPIDTLLEKPEVALEDLLDESDLIQELKQHNTKLIEYLREVRVLERLLNYVVAPRARPQSEVDAEAPGEGKDGQAKGKEPSAPKLRDAQENDEDEQEKKRNRYAYVSAEVLSSDNWSICEALMENPDLLRTFWDFLKAPPSLDPLQASYFTKVNEAMLDKKTEEMLDLFKSLDGAVQNMLQHVDSPMVMDLLLKVISLEKAEGGQGIVDWLHSQNLMPILLSFLSSEHSWATQTSAGDFLKAIITISANASQNEQSCIGPNELTRQLVSQPCIEKLISDMLKGGNPLTVGVGIVIEVIRKNNSDYDPEVGAEANATPSSRDPIYLGTLLRLFAQRVPDFMELILSPNHTIGGGNGPVTIKRRELTAAFGGKIEPLGFDRFKTCELMAELLHCSNMGLLNEVGSEEFVKARDAERERLKVEGKLGTSLNQTGSSEEELLMKSSTQTRLGSPDSSRKLEVQNASDDDGFEEVTHSGDLGDDARDDFDEKPGEDDLLTPTNSGTPLSFLEKDDEDFVDEPLSSPRLSARAEVRSLDEVDMTVPPLSPQKEHAQLAAVEDPKNSEADSQPRAPPRPIDEDTTSSVKSANESTGPVNEDVIEEVVAIAKSLELPVRLEQAVSEQETTPVVATGLSLEQPLAHPEDKPAPLFAKKPETPEDKTSQQPSPSSLETHHSAESIDTTLGEAGDSSTSIPFPSGDGTNQDIGTEDTQMTPVVGDYLKMQFVEHRVVPTILDFFFRFPWNNFLHNVVYDVVQQVFNGPMDRGFNRSLAIDLFETGDITMRIVDGQKKSDEAQEKNKMRLGYMGHLTLIAEEVVKFTERHPPELLADSVLEKVMNGEWITYVEVTLTETRERDNAVLGGARPDVTVGPRQAVMNAVNASVNFSGASAALAEAGLNGNAGVDSIDLGSNGSNGVGGFTLTSGTLLSGFGSSSDEEDDELDEENEEESNGRHVSAAEFSRYISTPSTTTATSESSTEPPSAPPPPPPPLNIPPSRARRQLAARLALHSRMKSEANQTANGERPEVRKNLNPFAAEEDSDEEEGGKDEFTVGDLEVEEEGKGHLPPNSILQGNDESVESLLQADKNVGIPRLTSSPADLNCGNGNENIRLSLSSLWPFASLKPKSQHANISRGFQEDKNALGGSQGAISINTADNITSQSSEDSDDSSDDGYGQSGVGGGEFGHDGQAFRGKRRLSVTTEAKRRTSLEDDDEDEEVVHIAMVEAQEEGKSDGKSDDADDGELVEIQHQHAEGLVAAGAVRKES